MERGSYRCDLGDRPAVVAVTEALSFVMGTPPEDLPSLHEYVDGDALNSLVEHGADVTVRFTYEGYTVEVTSRDVRVRENKHVAGQ